MWPRNVCIVNSNSGKDYSCDIKDFTRWVTIKGKTNIHWLGKVLQMLLGIDHTCLWNCTGKTKSIFFQ